MRVVCFGFFGCYTCAIATLKVTLEQILLNYALYEIDSDFADVTENGFLCWNIHLLCLLFIGDCY